MKMIYSLFPLVGFYLFLISATCIERKENPKPGEAQVAAVMPMTANRRRPTLNFFQKLSLKLFVTKNEQTETTKADKLASTSLILGNWSVWFLFLKLRSSVSVCWCHTSWHSCFHYPKKRCKAGHI